MSNKHYDDNFVEQEARYLIRNMAGYQEVADHFNVPLSTVGWHMKYRLKGQDPILHEQVMCIVGLHWRMRNEILARFGLTQSVKTHIHAGCVNAIVE